MDKKTVLRILVDVIMIVFVINAWWLFVLILAVVAVWNCSYYVEMILAGIMFDALFGSNMELGTAGYFGTLTAVVIFTIVIALKKVLRR